MPKPFAEMLEVGGKSNSLGHVEEIVQTVLMDQSRLEELYQCLFVDEPWYRMRAVDALEKVCRVKPEWLESYIDRLLTQIVSSDQPSIQWHLAQMFVEIKLNASQRQDAINWLTEQLKTTEVDWIVAANCMKSLMQFYQQGYYPRAQLIELLKVQQAHHSKSVVKLATKLLRQLEE